MNHRFRTKVARILNRERRSELTLIVLAQSVTALDELSIYETQIRSKTLHSVPSCIHYLTCGQMKELRVLHGSCISWSNNISAFVSKELNKFLPHILNQSFLFLSVWSFISYLLSSILF